MASGESEHTCILCGGTPLSKEHVWPKWLRTVLETEPGGLHIFHNRSEETGRRLAPVFSTEARIVCEGCNGGWMARLEGVCKPILTPLIEGRRRILEAFVLWPIALWAQKTMITLERATPDPNRIPLELRREIYLRRAPLMSSAVWLGRYTPGEPVAQFHLQQLAAPRSPDGELPADATAYWASLSIGELVLHVYTDTLPPDFHAGAVDLDLPAALTERLVQIWPPSPSVEWPPAKAFDEASYSLLESALDLGEPGG